MRSSLNSMMSGGMSAAMVAILFFLPSIPCIALTMKSSSVANSGVYSLGKRSTALDVLSALNKSSRLASYMTQSKQGVAVVTGGSSGIGAVSVETLALAGMRVVLCTRNVQKGEQVRGSMSPACRSNVRVQELDLADLTSVRLAAREICNTEGNMNVLLNNAGVMALPKRMATAQGLELQFGTNHVGHHMLTRLLLPNMLNGGRIVTVASTAHTMGELDFDDLNYSTGNRKYTPWGAYGQSKLANILFTKGLDHRLKSEEHGDIIAVSLHPGVIKTNLWQNTPRLVRDVASRLISDKSMEQGAATSIYCCIVKEGTFQGGEYCVDCGIARSDPFKENNIPFMSTQLWTATESILKNAGFELSERLFS